MKGIKLVVLVLSVICTMHLDAAASDRGSQLQLQKISSLEIKPVSNSISIKSLESTDAIVKRRKLSTTLRKPIVKKYRSKNHNLC